MFFLILIGLVFLVLYLRSRRTLELERFVLEHSTALRTLQDINSKFNFADVYIPNMQYSYDNEKMFDTISPRDYLTYQLVYDRQKIKESISASNKNKDLYRLYTDQVNALCKLGSFDAELKKNPIERYLPIELYSPIERCLEIEKAFFSRAYLCPTVEFRIHVRLFLTKINGRFRQCKQAEFEADEIEEITKKLEQKYNGLYLNREIWDALCRIERAKVSNKMRFAVYERDNHRCRKCGSNYNLEIDHIYPISKGGKSTFDNLQTLCHNCNSKKSNMIEYGASPSYTPHRSSAYICPNCGIKLVLRNGRYGEFYSCPNYPHCKFTKQQ